ncbi:MAG: single-stranded-DNA-specific exonuclease RecJ, partial [Candidatus Bipolaricaulota bacterium]
SDSTYPNRNLAGSGVSYKLASALKNSSPDKPGTDGALIQLAALGTVGDMVPLISGSEDENRRMVQMGLTALNRSPTVGLDALIERLGLKKKALTARTISFQIAPKLNAANRVGDPKVGFLLLTTRQAARAKYLAEVLVDYNEDRSDLQQRTTKEAKQKLEDRKITPQEEGVVFIKDEEWNPGIIGLTASKLANQYSLPACVLTRDGPRYKGSVRSVQGLNIIKGLTRCSDYLTRFGGHEMAGGFQLEPHQVGQFRECIGQWSSQILKDREKSEPQAAKKQIDAIINPHEIEERLLDEVNQLRPFGPGNPPPIFLLEEAPVSNLRKVGKRKNHLKMDLELETETFDCIGFNMAGALEQIKERERYNLVFQLEEDSWNDTCLQLKLEDLVL